MKWLAILIIVSLFVFFFYSGKIPYFQLNEQSISGHIVSTQGVVMGISQNDESFKNLKVNSPLFQSNKVKTGIKSSSLIEFGETFKILADTSIKLIHIGNRYEVHLLSGEIKRIKLTDKTDFFINNKKMNLKEIKFESRIKEPDLSDKKRISENRHMPQTKETQSSLQKTFKLHQRFMEKCFIKHYERMQGNTKEGLILVEFNIEKKGNLSSIEIKESEYKDDQFHDCLREVISRIQLKKQESEVLKVEFPIQVSLPF